jgi:DNA invertase Pin-like site-specific DNA recombinase
MASKRKAKKQKGDPVANELNAIKRLLILQLVTSGVQATDIASALQVDRSAISRLFPTRKVKRPSVR